MTDEILGGPAAAEIQECGQLAGRAIDGISSVVFGQDRVVRLMLATLLARGHALLEGAPGTAKTLLARCVARTVSARFKRIQFTPDLMPSDIIGTHIFDPRSQDFVVREGPVFTDVLLADEINRTPPKTQAALLEAMEERRVTLDGASREISPVFTVFATQNPLEFEGTYPLPEAQLDRFMMKIHVGHVDAEAEVEVLRRYPYSDSSHDAVDEQVSPIFDAELLDRLSRIITKVHCDEQVVRYVQQVLASTRSSRALIVGASTRAGLHLLQAARAWAAIEGRDFVSPDDIKSLASHVLAHRLILQADAQVDGLSSEQVLSELVGSIEVPR